MTTLENLWYGDIRPVEQFVEGNVEYKNLLRIVANNRKNLKQHSTPNKLNCSRNTTPPQTK